MRFPSLRARLLLPLTAFALGAVLALPAHAEEGPEGGDDRAKLKAQVEKVLRLMRENEDALLRASTQGGKAPAGPEVPVPDVPPEGAQGQPKGGGESGGGAGPAGGDDGGAEGEKARIAIEELLKGAKAGSGRIPVELEELIKMLPT